MISVAKALLSAVNKKSPLQVETLTEREQTQFDYLDAIIETNIHRHFNGSSMGMKLPADLVEMKVLNELKRRYEDDDGKWSFGIYPIPNDDGSCVREILLTLAPMVEGIEVPDKGPLPVARTLPSISSLADILPLLPATKRLHVRFPTRQRPAQAIAVLEKYRRMAGVPITIEVIIDSDDESMQTAEVMQRLAALDCIITCASHKSKVAACNGGRYDDWDILMLASDDMHPVAEDWGARVIAEMERCWPHLDGAIFFNDGFQRGHLCTLPVFGRRLYDQFGYIYEPEYKSLFCDREQTDVLNLLGRLIYIDEKLIEHRHHVWGRCEKDALYKKNDAFESEDQKTFEARKERGFDVPQLVLSVLICTVPKRKKQLEWLLQQLWGQIRDGLYATYCDRGVRRQVEILVDDRTDITVGEKRQALLERAKGVYVAFVDDDDAVSNDYLERILRALHETPDADCCSLVGVMTTRGERPERFEHSLKYDGWYTKKGVHYRTPNHLSVVRRDLALQVGFVTRNVGEDHDYSKRLHPLLKKEASTGEAPLYFYFYNPADSVQSK